MFPMTITVNNQAQLDAVMAAFSGKAVTPVKEAKKENPTPAPAPSAPVASPQPTAEVSAAPEQKALTYDEVKNLVLKVNREKGRDATVALLAQFGAMNAKEIPEAKWPDLVTEANKVLGNG